MDQTPRQPQRAARRDILLGGVALGVAGLLTGCGGRRAGAAFPGPVWPDEESGRVATMTDSSRFDPSQPVRNMNPRPSQGPIVRPGPVVAQATAGVHVNPRSTWTKAQPKWNLSKPMNGVRLITVHHDALNSARSSGFAFAADRLNSIRRSHMSRDASWVDIGYHFIIDPDGRVWEGRPLSIEGAHVARTNEHNMGIMLMGNFDEHRPTQQQLATLDTFVAQQMRAHGVPIQNIYTHQELKSTACPGRNLQGYMGNTRARTGQLRAMAMG